MRQVVTPSVPEPSADGAGLDRQMQGKGIHWRRRVRDVGQSGSDRSRPGRARSSISSGHISIVGISARRRRVRMRRTARRNRGRKQVRIRVESNRERDGPGRRGETRRLRGRNGVCSILLLPLPLDIKVIGPRWDRERMLVLRRIKLGMSRFRGGGKVVVTLAATATVAFWM